MIQSVRGEVRERERERGGRRQREREGGERERETERERISQTVKTSPIYGYTWEMFLSKRTIKTSLSPSLFRLLSFLFCGYWKSTSSVALIQISFTFSCSIKLTLYFSVTQEQRPTCLKERR